MGRDPQRSVGIVDSQWVKSTGVGREQRGYDGGKKVKGRKRHLLVDTQGLVLKAKVHAANVMDWAGIKMLLRRADEQFPRLKQLWLDSAYRGEDKGKDWVEKALGWSVDLVERPRKPAPEKGTSPSLPAMSSTRRIVASNPVSSHPCLRGSKTSTRQARRSLAVPATKSYAQGKHRLCRSLLRAGVARFLAMSLPRTPYTGSSVFEKTPSRQLGE
jgi:transposase